MKVRFLISTKISLAFGLILMSLIGIGYQSYNGSVNMEKQSDSIVLDAIPISTAADSLLADLVNEETGVRGYLVTGDEKFLDPYTLGKNQYQKDLQLIRSHENEHPIMKKLVENQALPQMDQLQSFFENEINLVKGAHFDQARKNIDNGKQFMDQFRQIHQKIQEDNQKLINDSWQASKDSGKQARMIIEIGVVIAFLISLVGGLLLARSIALPIRLVSRQLKEIAEGEGDLTKEIHIKSSDEIGILAQTFNQMLKNLRQLIGQIALTAEQVSASSEQLTASAEQTTKATEQVALISEELALGSDKQVKGIQQSAVAVQQMSHGLTQIAQNTQIASTNTHLALSKSLEGNQAIQKAVNEMRLIHQTVAELSRNIQGLGHRSNEINQIVEVITNIASQTNLLALNAAIEAARAGEHGRGFAIVADEVRKLAEQSSTSAGQIAELISTIQSETHQAVSLMEQGSQEVTTGIQSVNVAGTSFEEIQSAIQEVSSQVEDVSASTQQLSSYATQVVAAFDEIAAVTETTSAGSQNVSAATEEQLATMQEIASSAGALSSLAEEMQTVVGKFKV